MKTIRNSVLLLLIIATYKTFSQSFCKKQIDFSLGVGIKTTFQCPGSVSLVIGHLAVDYGLSDVISLGGFFSGLNSESIYSEKAWVTSGSIVTPSNWEHWTETHTWRMYIAGISAAYHFKNLIKNNKVDLYSGFMLGNNFVKHTFFTNSHISQNAIESPPNFNGGFIWSVYVGCRCRFNESAGVFVEAGYGVTYFSLGLNYKIVAVRKDKN